MSQSQREDKQKYLRQTILDREYDAEEFMDFCENYKGSIDIDSWTLKELKEIVQKFISTTSKSIQLSSSSSHYSGSGQGKNIDWDKAFEPIKQQDQAINLNLNSIDLDFLEMMGMNPSPPKAQKKTVPQKIVKPSEKKLTTDPNAILAKLNNKNTQFISAYNEFALSSRQKERQPQSFQKEETSPTLKKQQKTESQPGDVLIPVAKDNVIIDQSFKATVKCRTFTNKPKLDGDYEVTVTGHEVINPNPFVPNFVLYSITINPLGVEVKRRLKDFQSLRSLLKKIFPATQIPYLQRYGSRLSETEPSVIRKQKLFLQSYLNSLLMNKNIRCKIIDQFLLCDNLDSLKKIFRDFEKLDKPKGIEDLYTNSGKVEIQYHAQNKKFVSQQELYFDYLEPNLIKLKELYDQLQLSLTNSVKILGEIADLYDNLRDSTKNVNNLLNESLRSGFLETTFEKISDLHKHWALSMKTQAKVLEVEVRHLCRFENSNLQTIRQICKTSDSLVEAYAKRGDKLEATREQYQYNKRLGDYKNGVDSVSKNTTVLRFQAGFFLQSTVGEIRRYLSQFSDKFIKKFKIFSGLQLNICTDVQTNWREFQGFANVNYK